MWAGSKKPTQIGSVPTTATPIQVPVPGSSSAHHYSPAARSSSGAGPSNNRNHPRGTYAQFKPPRPSEGSQGFSKSTSSTQQQQQQHRTNSSVSQSSRHSQSTPHLAKPTKTLLLDDDDEDSTTRAAHLTEERERAERGKYGSSFDANADADDEPPTKKKESWKEEQDKYEQTQEYREVQKNREKLSREVDAGLKAPRTHQERLKTLEEDVAVSRNTSHSTIMANREKREKERDQAAKNKKSSTTSTAVPPSQHYGSSASSSSLSRTNNLFPKAMKTKPRAQRLEQVDIDDDDSQTDELDILSPDSKRVASGVTVAGGERKTSKDKGKGKERESIASPIKKKSKTKMKEPSTDTEAKPTFVVDVSSSPEKDRISKKEKDEKKKKAKRHPKTVESPPESPSSSSAAPLDLLAAAKLRKIVKEANEDEEANLQKAAKAERKRERKRKQKEMGQISDLDSSEDDDENDQGGGGDGMDLDVEDNRRWDDREDSLLAEDAPLPDPSTLCPFCSKPLPTEPSSRLVSLKAFLLSKPYIKPNPSRKNPLGMRLPITETASFCKRHEEEGVIIPLGKKRGWPTEIDWKAFEKRVRKETQREDGRLMQVIKGAESHFFQVAKEEWEKNGARKMANALSDWSSFDLEQPGYYGPRGFEIMMAVLRRSFIEDIPFLRKDLVAPLDPITYIRRILIPECAVELISQDQSCTRERALEIRAESRAYGKAVFNNSKEEEAEILEMEKKEEEKAKKKQERDEEIDKEKKRKAKLASMEKKEKEAAKAAKKKAKAKAAVATFKGDDSDSQGRPTTSAAPKRKFGQPIGATSKVAKVASSSTSASSAGEWSRNLRDAADSDNESVRRGGSPDSQGDETGPASSDLEIISSGKSDKEGKGKEKSKKSKGRLTESQSQDFSQGTAKAPPPARTTSNLKLDLSDSD